MAASNCLETGRCAPLSQGLDYHDHNVLHPDNHSVYNSVPTQAGEVSRPLMICSHLIHSFANLYDQGSQKQSAILISIKSIFMETILTKSQLS